MTSIPAISGDALLALLILLGLPILAGWSTYRHRHRAREKELVHEVESLKEEIHGTADFISVVTHEVRTPMNGILGMSEILQQTKLDTIQENCVETILKCVEQQESILTGVLDASKIESRVTKLESIPFDPIALLEDLCSTLENRCLDKGVGLELQFAPTIPRSLEGDPGKITQIAMNLTNNALKFTDEGQLSLFLSYRSDGVLEMRIQDTGIGIPKDKLQSVFEPYHQADASTNRKYGGTGLGLSICRDLCKLMGGKIAVQSEESKGSTFIVELPIFSLEDRTNLGPQPLQVVMDEGPGGEEQPYFTWLKNWGVSSPHETKVHLRRDSKGIWSLTHDNTTEPLQRTYLDRPHLLEALARLGFSDVANTIAEAEGLSLKLAPSQSPQPQALEGRSILLVEDNETNRIVCESLFERFHISYHSVVNGKEALDYLDQRSADVILMDCLMPVMDGYEATRHIRNLPGPVARIPIIALTANASHDDRQKCYQAGMDDYLLKPLKAEVFQDFLVKWKLIENAEVQPQTPQPSPRVDAVAPVHNDPQAPLEATGHKPELVKKVIDAYLKASKEGLLRLSDALEEGDMETVTREAHTLKSSSSYAGALRVSSWAKEVERVSRLLPRRNLHPLVQGLEKAHLRFLEELDKKAV